MTFENPSLLIITVVGILVLFFLMLNSRARSKRRMAEFASPRLLSKLMPTYSARITWIRNTLILLALLLLGVGLARPQWGSETLKIQGRGVDIIIALDASRSMRANDITPDRSTRAKLAIEELLLNLKGDRVGLVAFAGQAFLQTPLTYDYGAFRMALSAVEPGIIPHPGTNIATAIMEAEKAFSNETNAKILILISDGEDLGDSAVEAARKAAKSAITIYTVGVGSELGSRIQISDRFGNTEYLTDRDGLPVISRLDANTLRQIAEVTGGLYTPLGATGAGLRRIYDERIALIPAQLRDSEVREVPIERFPWFVVPGLILLTVAQAFSNRGARRKRGSLLASTATVILTTFGILLPATPAEASARSGLKALNSGETEHAFDILNQANRAEPSAVTAYHLGIAAYRLEDYSTAVEAFSQALATGDVTLQHDAFYNLGLAHLSSATGTQVNPFNLPNFNNQIRSTFDAAATALKQGETALVEIPLRRQAWTQCEQVLRAVRMTEQSVLDSTPAARSRHQRILAGENAWANANALFPEFEPTANSLANLREYLATVQPAWDELAQHERMLPEVRRALENMIRALKAPTEAVLEAERLADQWVSENQFIQAAELLNEVAQKDPTAAHFDKKRQRLNAIANILAPPAAPPPAPPTTELDPGSP